MDVHEDELIELEARAILIRSYVQILAQAPLEVSHSDTASNAYMQKLHKHVCALEPLAVHIGELRCLLAGSPAPQRQPDPDEVAEP